MRWDARPRILRSMKLRLVAATVIAGAALPAASASAVPVAGAVVDIYRTDVKLQVGGTRVPVADAQIDIFRTD
jgi:hypothetical protein